MKKKHYFPGLIGLLLIGGMILIFLFEPEESNKVIKEKTEITTEISIDIIKETNKKNRPISKSTSPSKKLQEKKLPAGSNANNENNYNGELPPISANYRKYLGFSKYAKEMNNRGALFFIHDTDNNKLYKINIPDKSITETDFKNIRLNKFSSRSRIITDEPALDYIVNNEKKKYDIKCPEVILLIPKFLENKILDSLINSDMPLNKISHFKAYYTNNKGGLTLSIHSAVISSKTSNINIEIAL